jgi:putative ABC transport system permease protein
LAWRHSSSPFSAPDPDECIRIFRKTPGFAILASGSLAIALALTAALAGVAEAILFRPLPVDHPKEIVRLFTASQAQPLGFSSFPDFDDLHRTSQTVSMVAQTQILVAVSIDQGPHSSGLNNSVGSFRNFPAAEPPVPQVRLGLAVSPGYFEVLRVRAKIGRVFQPADSREPVVVLANEFWKSQFEANPQIIGRTIRLGGTPFMVIGVAPENFGLDRFIHEDFYVPIQVYDAGLLPSTGNPTQARARRYLSLYARLRPGAAIGPARAEIAALGDRLESEYPSTNRGRRGVVLSELDSRMQADRTMPALARLLIAVAGLILAIACANVAGLLLLRAETRSSVIAIQMALGATRARLLVENLSLAATLAIAGAVFSIPLAWFAMRVLERMATLPSDIHFAVVPKIDAPVLLLTALAALLVTITCGFAVPRTGTLPSRAGGFGTRLRDGLVILEIALASALLAAGASLGGAISSATKIDPGYRTDHVLTMALDPAQIRYNESQARAFYDQALDRVARLPGVKAASLAQSAPLGFMGAQRQIEIAGEPESSAIWINLVTPGYFDLLRIPILQGRAFDRRDTSSSPPVAIVNQELGKRCGVGARFKMNGRMVEVIGIARDAKYFAIGEPPRPYFYLPFSQNYASRMTLHVQTAGDPAASAHAVAAEIRAIDAAQPVSEVRPMADYLTQGATFHARVALQAIAAVGSCGLLLALAGLYGVVSRWVTARQREIGIRMALGAKRGQVVRMILARAARLSLIGTGAGILAASAAERFLAGLIPGAQFSNTLVTASALVFACSLISALIPALRAARIDPARCLRQ